MQYWVALNRAVEVNLAKGYVGQPVFVRCTAAVAERVETIKDHLSEMIYYVNGWLTASIRRIYAMGKQTQGHVVISLEYDSGCSALLTCTLEHKLPQIDLTILGSSGAIYHQELILRPRDDSLTPKAMDHMQHLMIVVDQSLATGQPVDL